MEKCSKLEPKQFLEWNVQTPFSSSANFQRFTYLSPATVVLNPKGTNCALKYQDKVSERLNSQCDKLVYIYCIPVLCIWKKLVLKPQSRTESFEAFIKATTTREQIMELRLKKVSILDLIYSPKCVMFLDISTKFAQYFHKLQKKYFKIEARYIFDTSSGST